MADDFGAVAPESSIATPVKGQKRKRDDQGMEREWLKVYETLPAQLLNVYGEARFASLPDKAV